ncbi:serine/threonine protein kinase [Marinicrinis lubricantis]|uniref:non-specific serine/threonine protein kinase n=1 Tax=Marinicrinis lubricantis TaxID=2086470 RepID=A0ABW1ITT2_9BACL
MQERIDGRSYRLAERYEILRELGRGGMGTVYLARDLKLNGKLWAIKRCSTSANSNWNTEASMLMELDHPLLPRIVDCVRWGSDRVGIVMDYIEGPTLLQLFEQHQKSLPERRWLKYIVQICEALQYLHERPEPIIYRDLKPANIIIDSYDNARLIDFGISRVFQADKHHDTVQLGTRGFAAPEQLRGLQTDPRTDIYQLGALIFYFLSGGEYAANQSLEQVIQDSSWLVILRKMLDEQPARRYQSAEEVKRSLLLMMKQYPNAQGDKQDEPSELRIIAVVSAYAGAGASYVADAAALAIEKAGLPCAIVEWKDRAVVSEKKKMGKRIVRQQVEWERREDWLKYQQEERAAGAQVLVMDLGDHIEWVEQMELPIEHVWVVADGFPHKFNGPEAAVSFRRAISLRKLGYHVEWIANRAPIQSKYRNTWLDSFPWKPICHFPNVDYEEWIEAEWEGRHILQSKARYEQVTELLKPAVEHVIAGLGQRKKKRWFNL